MLDRLREVIGKLHPVSSGYELMRVGAIRDAGYLIPDALEGIRYCFSPGVSGDTKLEDQLAEKGLDCFLLDGYYDSPVFKHPAKIHFEKMYLKKEDSHNSLTLDTWKQKSIGDYKGDLLLQMDIEGWEYETLGSVSDELLQQFRIMVVEFHDLNVIVNGTWLNVFERICEHFKVVHIHTNNFIQPETFTIVDDLVIPKVLEITFMRTDALKGDLQPVTSLPHPLDADNDPNQPSLTLPECWYR